MLDKANDAQTAMAPRAVIEYVEVYEMPRLNITEGSRKKKWEQFYDTPIGMELLHCVRKKIPTWKKIQKPELCDKVQNMYQFSSEYYHRTAYDINDFKYIVVRGEMLSQTAMFISCVAMAFDLKFTRE